MQEKLGTPRLVIGKNFQCPNMHTSLFSTKVGKAYSSHLPALTFPSHHLLLRNQEEKLPSHCTQICPCSHLVLLPLFTLFLLWLPASLIWTSCRRLEPKEQSDIATVPNPQPKQTSVQSLLTSLVIILSYFFRLMVGDLFNIKNMDKSYSTLLLLSTVLLILLYTTTTVYS